MSADVNGFPVVHGRTPVLTEPPTIGVEEEFALLDPRTGTVVPCAADVVADCEDADSIVEESMQYMVETRTPVCRTLADVESNLLPARRRVARAARRHAAVSVASGVVPFGLPAQLPLTDAPRYRELARRFPLAMSTAGYCGCHVHVGVPSRQIGVAVLLRIRRWLPALVALTANSPIWWGRETAWASRRFTFASRWPTAVPAPPVTSIDAYDRAVDDAVASGDALDARSVYFLARLSPRYPTVEVRVADVMLTSRETLCFAGLVRALVATAVDQELGGLAVAPVREVRLRRACRDSARTGLRGTIDDPATGTPVRPWDLLDALVAQIRPRLEAHGDEEPVLATLERIRTLGGGADRQRRLFRSARSAEDFVHALATTTTSVASTAALGQEG